MATISSTNLLALADNVAKAITDLNAALNTNIGSNAPTTTTITNGMTASSNSMESRIAALNDFSQINYLSVKAGTTASNVTGLLSGIPLANIYAAFAPYMDALDLATGGLNAFLGTNTVKTQAYFTACFNAYVNNSVGLGLRGPANIATAITTANSFPTADSSDLATISVSGAAAGTYSAGTAISAGSNVLGSFPLWIYNNSAGAAAAQTVLSIAYTDANGSAQTLSFTLPSTFNNTKTNAVALGVTGSAVTGITVVSSGTSGESYKIYAKSIRSVAY
jgi:hypothetical protein